jgi:hypothetical protein
MKSTHISWASVAGLALLVTPLPNAGAFPVGHPNSTRNYIVGLQSLHYWSAGIYGEGCDREVTVDGRNRMLTKTRVMGYVGLDVLPWVTLYGTGGSSALKFGGTEETNDAELEYGGGLNINVLDHEVLDPTLFEDRLRINANVSLIHGTTAWDEPLAVQEFEWDEVSASVIFSIVNDCEGEKKYVPNSVTVFVGPIYSDYLGSEIEVVDKAGFLAGLEIFYSASLSFNIGIESFGGESGYMGGVHLRF